MTTTEQRRTCVVCGARFDFSVPESPDSCPPNTCSGPCSERLAHQQARLNEAQHTGDWSLFAKSREVGR